MTTAKAPDVIEAEATITALAPVPVPDTPMPVFSGAQMATAYHAYRELQKALDQAMPDQIMQLSGRPFRKKGYWRAVAVAFKLDVRCTQQERVEHIGLDGNLDWGWQVTYTATAPNGRAADGDGSCFASEKNRGRMQATEHNVRSHAHTRAFNRAVSNLVGFGEVSAEEATKDEQAEPKSAIAPEMIAALRDEQYYIVGIRTLKTGEKDGRGWALRAITVHTGQAFQTFDDEIVKTAKFCLDDLRPASIQTEQFEKNGKKGTQIVTIGQLFKPGEEKVL